MKRILEIAVFNAQAALAAAAAGADRLELCDNIHEGGTTPSYGTIKLVRRKVQVPVFAMIRPRGGDFLYDNDELSIMQHDIAACKQLGCDGVVLGLLTGDGQVNKPVTSRLVELAYPMEVTFHRAFDRAANAFTALEDVIDCGCQRILTSGQRNTAPEGVELLAELVEKAADRIIVMPGSGVRSSVLKGLAEKTGACEFHSSARMVSTSGMHYINPQMTNDNDWYGVDKADIEKMKTTLASLGDV